MGLLFHLRLYIAQVHRYVPAVGKGQWFLHVQQTNAHIPFAKQIFDPVDHLLGFRGQVKADENVVIIRHNYTPVPELLCAAWIAHGRCDAVYTENADHRQTVEYFIIVIVILVLAAKLMQLRTPRRENHLAALRTYGREVGLRIELVSDLWGVDTAGATPAVRYLLPWPLSFDTQAGFISWTLVRDTRRGEESVWHGWRWQNARAPELAGAALGEVLTQLPPDAMAVQCDRFGLSVYWRELGDMNSVAKFLSGLKKIRNKYIKQ